MSFRTVRKILGWLLVAATFVLGWGKWLTDQIGRTTVIDDAKQLGERIAAVIAFLSAQPAFWFYTTCALLFLLGLALLVPQERWSSWLSRFRDDLPEEPSTDTKRKLNRFLLDYLAPACERHMEMDRAMNQADADRGSAKCKLMDDPNYQKLAGMLYSSPAMVPEYPETLGIIKQLENKKYWEACQPCAMAASDSGDPKVRASYASWVEAHNAMVNAYEAIKTEPDFKQLYRARLPSRWGGLLDSPKQVCVDDLVEMFDEGVIERNRLIRAVPKFDYASERERLVNWSDRVVTRMERGVVTAAERSRFKTLGHFVPEPIGSEIMLDGQLQLQTIWTEKLNRLRAIIDRIGG